VDPVPFREDVFFHPRIPALDLVAEMDPGFKQILHGDYRHNFLHASAVSGCPGNPSAGQAPAQRQRPESDATPSLYLAPRQGGAENSRKNAVFPRGFQQL
jgi:hypothetical protein